MQVIAILKVLQKKEGEEKYVRATKTNFEGTYLSNGLADWAKIWNWKCPQPEKIPKRNWLVFVGGVSSYRCIKTALSWSCLYTINITSNIHTITT